MAQTTITARALEGWTDEKLKSFVRRISTQYTADQELCVSAESDEAALFDQALTRLEEHGFLPIWKRNGKLGFTRLPNGESEQFWDQRGRELATQFIAERRAGTQGWEQLLASIEEQEQIALNCQQILRGLELQPKPLTWKGIFEWHQSRYALQKKLTYAKAIADRYERESARY